MNFCKFVCPGQTGHTVLAHILDSHPDCIIAEESKLVTRIVKRSWSLDKVIDRVKASSSQVMDVYKEYGTYERPFGSYRNKFGQITKWNGRYRDLKVIGDKHGWDLLSKNRPNLFEIMERRLEIPVKVIHMVRDPFEIVSSWYLGHIESNKKKSEPRIELKIDDLEKIHALSKLLCYDSKFPNVILVKLEDLIEYPRNSLIRISDFLGLDLNEEVMKGAEQVLFKSPRSYKRQVPWNRDHIKTVNEMIERYEFLEGYKQ